MVSPSPRRPALNYAKAWAFIKPYVSHRLRKRKGKGFHPSDRKFIRAYSEVISNLKDSRNVRIYKPKAGKTKKQKAAAEAKLRKVQAYAQHPPGYDKLRVAFLPVPKGIKTKLFVGRDSVTLSGGGVRKRVWLFDNLPGKQAGALLDPQKVADEILKRDKRSVEFAVACGEHEALKLSRDLLGEQLREYVETYGEITGNHNVRNWLVGVVGYEFGDQGTADDYYKAQGTKGRRSARDWKKYGTKATITKKRKPPRGRENER